MSNNELQADLAAPLVSRVPLAPPAAEIAPSRPSQPTPAAQPSAARPPNSAPAPREAPLNLMEEQRRKDMIGSAVVAARRALRQGQKEAARDKLKEAFELSPTDAGALELLGDIFMEEGEQEKALRVYERGMGFHPRHVAFEEKIALAYLDMGEMQRDAERRSIMAENAKFDNLLERNPKRAFTLSLVIPGSGQYYNGDAEKAALFGGTATVLFLLWCVPMLLGISALPDGQKRAAFSHVLSGWPTLGVGLFWIVFLAWIGTHIVAARDAWAGANHANEGLEYGVGIEV